MVANNQKGWRKWSTLIAFAMLLGALLMALKAFVAEYVIYRAKTDNNSEQLTELTLAVKGLTKLLPQEESDTSKEIDNLRQQHAVLAATVSNNHALIGATREYQDVLRDELKGVAENKLNTVDFWRMLNTFIIPNTNQNEEKKK